MRRPRRKGETIRIKEIRDQEEIPVWSKRIYESPNEGLERKHVFEFPRDESEDGEEWRREKTMWIDNILAEKARRMLSLKRNIEFEEVGEKRDSRILTEKDE